MTDGTITSHPLITRKLVHQALKQFHGTSMLKDHPLTGLGSVAAHRQEAGYADTPSGKGLALRAMLREIILALRPANDENPADRNWRIFSILSERYLQRRSPSAIADNLGIARSTYDHEHAAALDAIAEMLQQAEERQVQSYNLQEPFFVPANVSHPLVGRQVDLANLQQILARSATTATVFGLPGIGKTAVALAFAHDPTIRAVYSGGILWAGLGQSPNLPGLLNTWGLAMGLRTQELGHLTDLRDRANAIRALIGTRKMLLILDDVWSAQDALSLKIGGPECSYLLTTRLPGIAIDLAGEFAIELTELDTADAAALLAEFIPEALSANPGIAHTLHEAAGGLPLTLNLMGSYLRREYRLGGARRFEQGLERLQGSHGRLQLSVSTSSLDESPSLPLDTPRSLMSIIALSMDALTPVDQDALLALSVFPPRPNTFSEAAALAVSGAPTSTLDALCDSGLLSVIIAGRYAAHRAISEFASQKLAQTADGDPIAARRLVQFYSDPTSDLPEIDDPDFENLLAALNFADRLDLSSPFLQLLNTIYPLIEMRGLYSDAHRYLERASTLVESSVEPGEQIMVLNNRGRIALREGKYEEAEGFLNRGIDLVESTGYDRVLNVLEAGLGVIALNRGSYADAQLHFERALVLARGAGDQSSSRALLANLGSLALTRGNDGEAKHLLSEALLEARASGDRSGSSAALANLGVLAARHRDFLNAESYFEESLRLSNQVGNRQSMSSLLTNLGALASDRGDEDVASAYFDQALDLAREMGQQDRLCQLLANQGALAIRQGDLEAAQGYLQEGLALAQAISHQETTVQLYANLGALFEARGDQAKALDYLREGLTLASKLGLTRYTSAIQTQIDTLKNQ